MHRTLAILGLGALLVAGAATADASTLSLTPADATCTTDINSNLSGASLRAILDGCFGVDAPALSLLYKSDVGGGDSGTFASSYDTTFTNAALDPQNAFIRYIAGPYIGCIECYLVVKDGKHSPAQYLFDISTWNGTDNIDLTGFWPAQGAISNVAIWGDAKSVPEPATLLLTGIGFAIAAVRRRRPRARVVTL